MGLECFISNIMMFVCDGLALKEWHAIAGVILGLRPANQRRLSKVKPYLIGWAQS